MYMHTHYCFMYRKYTKYPAIQFLSHLPQDSTSPLPPPTPGGYIYQLLLQHNIIILKYKSRSCGYRQSFLIHKHLTDQSSSIVSYLLHKLPSFTYICLLSAAEAKLDFVTNMDRDAATIYPEAAGDKPSLITNITESGYNMGGKL